MIGVYDYTVIATYLSLLLGLSGIFAAMESNCAASIVCLLLAGLLDAFDGRIARTKKNRTLTEKRFGIQIDSLNDLVCFGVLPAVIAAAIGEGQWWLLTTASFFPLCALIRLAYFNVSEEERQDHEAGGRKYYLGVPVTSVAFVAPLFFLLPYYIPQLPAVPVYAFGLCLLGVLFISPVHIKKPGLAGIGIMALFGIAEAAALLFVLMGL